MHIYVRRGGPNYQTGLAKMRSLGEELGVPLEVGNTKLSSCKIFRELNSVGSCGFDWEVIIIFQTRKGRKTMESS